MLKLCDICYITVFQEHEYVFSHKIIISCKKKAILAIVNPKI